MARTRRPSPQTAAVLRELAAQPVEWRYGYELGQQVGLKAGSLYPILIRLADRGLLEARWEEPSEQPAGRPPRHLYRLTGSGRELAAQLDPVATPSRRRTHGGLQSALVSAPPRAMRAARYLDVVVRLLPRPGASGVKRCGPSSATITSPAERRRFALGCTRVALSPTPGTRAIAHHLAALGAAALVLAAALALTARDRADRPGARPARGTRLARSPPGAVRPRRPGPGSARRAHRRARTRGIVPARHGGGTRDGRTPAARSRRHGRHALADVPRCSPARRHRTRQSPRRRRAGLRVGCRSRLGGGRIRRPAVRTPRGAAGRPAPGPRNLARAGRVRRAGPRRSAHSPAYPVRRSGRGRGALRRDVRGARRRARRARYRCAPPRADPASARRDDAARHERRRREPPKTRSQPRTTMQGCFSSARC